ncbi:putative phosphatidic acid phosphatase type 2 domain containing 1B [Operophtera brumata]|uniref:Putative phosphatidic acid phosphatase type 2 domain containing 1B n=1 Tax=Operophtera brumata TaxID=104452 RepID=A0A0L7KMM6_OPEBR|nr:putative phosphatidic acid phosphatase type 2 domain containing 1B [Operophtera brumata]
MFLTPDAMIPVSFCSLGVGAAWLCGRLRVVSRRRGHGLRVVTALAPLVGAGCYYNPLSSDLAGTPYVVSQHASYCSGKPDISPVREREETTPLLNGAKKDDNGKPDIGPVREREETTPLLNGAKKDDKWI